MPISESPPASWLMMVFTLSAKQASERVEIWRKPKRMGALPLGNSGYLLPPGKENQEKFEWLAASIRRCQGQASELQVHSIDGFPAEEIRWRFLDAAKKIARRQLSSAPLIPLRRCFEEISAIDFFNSPLASRGEAWLARAAQPPAAPRNGVRRDDKKFHRRTWVDATSPRHRARFLRLADSQVHRPAAKFVFAAQSKDVPGAIPFDMFHDDGFGRRGHDCTFERLRKQFAVRGQKVITIAENHP